MPVVMNKLCLQINQMKIKFNKCYTTNEQVGCFNIRFVDF